MRDNSYTVLKRWMATELHLAGNELIIFAVLYGYTVNGKGYYSGLSDLTLWTGITERGVIKVINRLVELGYVERCGSFDGRSTMTYRTTVGGEQSSRVGEQSSCRGEQSSCRGEQSSCRGEQSSPNNIDNINNINNINIPQSAAAELRDTQSIEVKPPRTKPVLTDLIKKYSDEFTEVWNLYPRHVAKANALKAYAKARSNGTSKETIIEGVKAYAAYCKRECKETEYILHGSTYFNQHRWEDDYSVTSPTAPQFPAESEQDKALHRILYERQQARKGAMNGAVTE